MFRLPLARTFVELSAHYFLHAVEITDPPAKAEDPSARVKFAAVDDDTDFDAPIPANPAQASGPLAGAPIVDDECYMGKDNELEECADFGACFVLAYGATTCRLSLAAHVL